MSARNLAQTLPDLSDPFVGSQPRREEGFSFLGDNNPLVSSTGFAEWPVARATPAGAEDDAPVSDVLAELIDEPQVPEIDRSTHENTDHPPLLDIDNISRRHADEIERLRAEHAEQIETLRQEIADREIDELSQRVSEIQDEALAQLEARVADTLGQVFGEAIAEQSIEMLCKWLKARLQQPGAVLIDLRGPSALTGKIGSKLGDAAPQIRITESESCDLYVEIDGEVLATRLGEWRMMVEDCLS